LGHSHSGLCAFAPQTPPTYQAAFPLLDCLFRPPPHFSSTPALRYTLPSASRAWARKVSLQPVCCHAMGQITAILPAAGLGTRMGAETPKQFLELDGVPIAVLSVRRIASCPLVTQIIVATRQDGIEKLEARLRQEKFKQPVRVIKGGDSRQESVAAALKLVSNDTELVLVHDAVRPFVSPEHITRVIEEARRCKAAIVGIPAMDTVKEVKRASLPEDVALITNTVPRERIVLAQTPQVFETRLLKEAFVRAEADGVNASDEAGLVERLGYDVHVIHGSERNIKITKPADMELARFYMQLEQKKA
jgi:2-C-methyl-D-erythritol 4-phosphate cytidylyltransferase